jgi:hypothetical protein
MKPLSHHLTDLIAIIEDVIRSGRFGASGVKVAAIAAEIRREHRLPAEGIRCTYTAVAVLELIEGLNATNGEAFARRATTLSTPVSLLATPWLMLIGAALPLLRAEAYQALLNEKEARGR